jgi:ATP-dependent DNA helicase PIF1
MEPVTTLIALTAAFGFIWRALKAPPQSQKKPTHELDYRPAEVATSKKGRAAEFDVSAVDVLPEYEVVRDLVQEGFPLVFVTGSAGTGKSTFIRWMQHEFNGSILVAAPTGMAAINIDGQTLHRLCSLPPAFILKPDIKLDNRRLDIRRAKVLIIDEVTMVTANLLDAVSAYLKRNRNNERPFGGLPIVIVGDLFQLPPIVTNDVRALFTRHYGTAKFFNARSVQMSNYYAVELKKTYRQSDQHFVDLLAKIRVGHDLAATLDEFNGACAITGIAQEGAVFLSPRNAEVDRINGRKLGAIEKPEFVYHAVTNGKFKRERGPAPQILRLRVGAQVMFTKNGRRSGWVNGSVGTVRALANDKVTVELDTGQTVHVTVETWDEFEYRWNANESRIDRTVTGSYMQIPLMLGWAITIHKSQGKTIERVHLDLGAGAFETGQTYVALSRCRALSGLTMSRRLTEADIMVDKESKDFHQKLLEVMKILPVDAMKNKVAQARLEASTKI